jgi:hypothetical protein
MEILVHPVDSRKSDKPPDLSRLNLHVQNFGTTEAEVRRNGSGAAGPLHLSHCLAEDAHGSHIVNFPFEFTVFLILTTGVTLVGSGIIVTNAWLFGTGAFTTLVGCFLYGWSLHDD